MFVNEKAMQTFLQHLPVPLWHIFFKIPSKRIVQTCDDFEILMHTSKGEQINFKFLFILFTCWLLR